MCGRFTSTRIDKEQLARLGIKAPPEFKPRYNIAPTQNAWIIVADEEGSPALSQMRWGLVPPWAKEGSMGAKLINARCETLADKPAFRTSFKKRRCLVLADGFYEWKKNAGGKIPIYIRFKTGRPFAFAGLWDRWRGLEGEMESFCIITSEPNSLLEDIHDRMPVIVREEDYPCWLDPEAGIKALEPFLKPYAAEVMECFPVSRLVNSPRHDCLECVQPINEDGDANRRPDEELF
jgi:putative SOS response-associated peptidase YedK